MKVVINKCYGGFGLSPEAVIELYKIGSPLIEKITIEKYTGGREKPEKYLKQFHKRADGFLEADGLMKTLYDPKEKVILSDNARDDENRSHKDLVDVVEKLGAKADGWAANLKIVEIPDGIEWEIDDYDGIETVQEKHRGWG
jgi:hypothetical protein